MRLVIKPLLLYFQQIKHDGDRGTDDDESEEDESDEGESEEDDGEDDDDDKSEDQKESGAKPRKLSQNDSNINGPTREELEKTAEGQDGLLEDDGLQTGIVKSPSLNFHVKSWYLNVICSY